MIDVTMRPPPVGPRRPSTLGWIVIAVIVLGFIWLCLGD